MWLCLESLSSLQEFAEGVQAAELVEQVVAQPFEELVRLPEEAVSLRPLASDASKPAVPPTPEALH